VNGDENGETSCGGRLSPRHLARQRTTTVRNVARAAGLSTGAVFGNFTDKDDLFAAIVRPRLAALAEAIRRRRSSLVGCKARLLDYGLALVEFCADDPKLVQCALQRAIVCGGPGWAPLKAAELRALVGDVFGDAVAQGELPAGSDAEFLSQLVCDAIQGVCLATLFAQADVDMARRMAAKRIGLILTGAGYGARSQPDEG
jgi:AcrR family transcriptional regulator